VSGGDDCTVRLWSIREECPTAVIDAKANVCSVQFSPVSSNLLAFGSANYRVYLYDLRQMQVTLSCSSLLEYLEFIPHAPILCAGPAAFVMGLSSVLPSLMCLLRVGFLKWEFEALATGASCNIILLRMPQPKIRCSFLQCFTLEAQVFQMCYTVKALAAMQWSMQSSVSVHCHSGVHGRLPCSHCCI